MWKGQKNIYVSNKYSFLVFVDFFCGTPQTKSEFNYALLLCGQGIMNGMVKYALV